MVDIWAYSAVLYPKSVTIEDNTTHLSFRPDDDPSKAFDIETAVAEQMIADLVTARPTSVTNLVDSNIKAWVTIAGIVGTYGPGADPFLLPENIKSGITIYGVTSNMPLGADVAGADGDLVITIPEWRYDGIKTTTASDANLIAGNIKPGVTIFGVASTMPEWADIVDAQAVTPIPIPAGYYDGTETVHA